MKKQVQIGGVIPFSALDYPDHLSAVIFCQGCAWRCGYCHNHSLQPFSKSLETYQDRDQTWNLGGSQSSPDLIDCKDGHVPATWPTNNRSKMDHYDGRKNSKVDSDLGINQWERVFAFLEKRKDLLDGVVFSGGEPTLQLALPKALSQVKNLGYKIGLHTAGICPSRLKRVLPLLDWIGMDFKAPANKYDAVTRIPGSYKSARMSAQMVTDSGIDYEFRTTVHRSLLTEEDLQNMADELSNMGAQHLVLQKFQPNGCGENLLVEEANFCHIPCQIEEKISPLFESFSIRR